MDFDFVYIFSCNQDPAVDKCLEINSWRHLKNKIIETSLLVSDFLQKRENGSVVVVDVGDQFEILVSD